MWSRHQEGADPSAVIYDAIQSAKAKKIDVLICDTAGRLQNKKNLMDELNKMNKVIGREYPEAARENLLVSMPRQERTLFPRYKEFGDVADITGIVLTKLDGTAKGGIVVTIADEFDMPVKFIGVGEGIEDLKEFDPENLRKEFFMSKPLVAVVGRPNVGKSTFFNKVVGKRVSIVEDTPGVTRDRIYAEAEWSGMHFALIDTGGIEPDSKDIILSQMREQAEMAMDTSDVILFMVDGKEGITAADREVASMLMKTGKKVVLAVNKVDKAELPDDFYDFYELGLGEPIPISAANMLNLGDLLDGIVDSFPEGAGMEEDDSIKIAMIGKPNVGKSSLVNRLLGEDRVIVSPIAGTTRDSIDTPFEKDGEQYLLIDTAGIRRKSKVNEDIEKFSVLRAVAAIERCDVCLLMIDAQEGITEQDKKIAGIAHEAGKGIVVVVNKWDLLEKDNHTMNDFKKEIARELTFMSYAPSVFISALTGQRVDNVIAMAKYVAENRAMRIPTGQLNSLITDATMMKQPPSDKGKRLKIYYVTQVGVKPPLFSFKINSRPLMHFSYSRYLENKIRESFGFEGTPLKFVFREKGEKEDV